MTEMRDRTWPCPKCRNEDQSLMRWGLTRRETTGDGRKQDIVDYECDACGESGSEVVWTGSAG
ncbi:hypothetical protein ACIQNU_02415 [Streptomyces sp. NPDC091292]|uniref:hypothetical protein n=1 Tax=Streptomyces sp. NPDC091292 TaxID=3365991 RepID=UPI0037F636C9